MDNRIEKDSMGEMPVPKEAYYGAQTARAVENFPISGIQIPSAIIQALAMIKKHAARTNAELGLLDEKIARAIEKAAGEIQEGKLADQFPVDVFQTGSGTSTNMNVNEVIARRAAEILGNSSIKIHPNDHVNLGQSSNDTFPSAIHIAAALEVRRKLLPAAQELAEGLREFSKKSWEVIKTGRTHWQDATPVRMGQEFAGYATQIEHAMGRVENATSSLYELPLGGTAVGTGINAHERFAELVVEGIIGETNRDFREAADHFEAQGARDACVELSGALRGLAVSLFKIGNDVRFLGCGPRTGINEIHLPATQPGSSIMPGKVNPVIVEMLLQVCAQVIGNDTCIAFAGTQGHLELHVMMPVMGMNLMQNIQLLSNGMLVFNRKCVSGLTVNSEKVEADLDRSLALCTPLALEIGYEKAAEVAKKASAENKTIRQAAEECTSISAKRLDELLDPRHLIGQR